MKVVENRNTIQRHGIMRRKECSIKANAFSFRTLIRQYSNPPKAILQEISANAADSHIRVGKSDVPFHVHLPSKLDHHLRVRDFGVSMCPDTVFGLYSELMNSDKRHTNDETGAFGVGRITPLSYTDTFNITTYNDGTMRMYSMGYNEKDIPEINQFAEYETDEPNGVEVSFAIQDQDWKLFYDAAKHVYSFFDTKPVVNGLDDFATNIYNKQVEGKNWYLTGYGQPCYVIMGNVAYKLDDYRLKAPNGGSLLSYGVHFKMPMGSVHMTPSREALEYSDVTVNNIKKRLEEIYVECSAMLNERLNTAHSSWNASCIDRQLCSEFSGLRWDTTGCKFKILNSVVQSEVGDFKYKYYYNYNRVSRSQLEDYRVRVSNKTVFVIQDMEKGFDKRCRQLVTEKKVNVYLLKDTNTKQEVMNNIGAIAADGAVFLASELPEPPKAATGPRKPRSKTKKLEKYVHSRSGYYRSYNSRNWDEYEVDPTVGDHVYVKLHRYEADINVRNVYNYLKSLGVNVPEIVGLIPKYHSLADRKNFTSLLDWVHNKLDGLIDARVAQECIKHTTYHAINNKDLLFKLARSNEYTFKDINHPFKKLCDFVYDFKKSKNNEFVDNVLALAKAAGYTIKMGKTNPEILELQAQCKQKYPLVMDFLDMVSTYTLDTDKCGHIIATVNRLGV